jgi:hypothetical protein
VKAAARLCFAASVALFSGGLVIDKGGAGLAVLLGLALQALGFFFMTLR